jgi:acetyl-CoA carboxylase biotin carboxyl carrier protein
MIEIRAEMDANVWQVLVESGQTVAEDDELMILESMKMEIPVIAPCDGTIASVDVGESDSVKRGATLIKLQPS